MLLWHPLLFAAIATFSLVCLSASYVPCRQLCLPAVHFHLSPNLSRLAPLVVPRDAPVLHHQARILAFFSVLLRGIAGFCARFRCLLFAYLEIVVPLGLLVRVHVGHHPVKCIVPALLRKLSFSSQAACAAIFAFAVVLLLPIVALLAPTGTVPVHFEFAIAVSPKHTRVARGACALVAFSIG